MLTQLKLGKHESFVTQARI